MKKIISMILVLLIIAGAVGCESKEERQTKILEATKNKIECLMAGNEAWSQLTDKEWEISKHDDKYIVTLHANISYYMMSCEVSYVFTVSNDLYLSKIAMHIGDYSREENFNKNENSKLDI